ncbi:nucleotide pyrophosphohydrolase [Vibrio cholerae]|uniref:MazG nucleotide pyrophosphohydrolase domain-containing protein n=1 Tax=Vibrio cholerae TaxID=666 RepID=UPI000BA961F7|nr:MazG nucleotide pyrophosphohydrolase domain-containing protein [Vibrio cholerae]EGQ7944602.1 nucleotide pyrophosphohydrolase [Vibrio cholerae]EGQ9837196.1 nucleotide pyrophosphohydrolase [Vibrio cholerae]EII3094231.1 nucleotide pyrophosphohydrolase [Vibrio cholerae]EJL6424411.1 nucleotide pyrophosphohydrolase [Vibrio cholerae]EJL6471072.1 nucleotide pyrophosphohydrolase [Vibrio cholerae]
MQHLDKLFEIAKRKSEFDKSNSWYLGSSTYLAEIKKEVDEVVEEIPKNRLCYLEDELGDVLWDYLNAILSLEKETGVKIESVVQRACRKYEERVSAIENGISWDEVKLKQKKELEQEQSSEHT